MKIKTHRTPKIQKQTQQIFNSLKKNYKQKNSQTYVQHTIEDHQLNAYVKPHKEDMPIRSVINNTEATSHKTAEFLKNNLKIIQLFTK